MDSAEFRVPSAGEPAVDPARVVHLVEDDPVR